MNQENINNFNIKHDYDTSKVSWLKSGGKSKYYCNIKNDKDLIKLFTYINNSKIPFMVIGNFSNTLIRFNGFNGIMIKLSGEYSQIIKNSDSIEVGASTLDQSFSMFCYENSITGYEFLYTVPGSIGGNIFMNAGCFGTDISSKVLKVRILNIKNLKIYDIDSNEIDFQYRKGLQDKTLIILGATLKIKYQNKEKIKLKMKEFDYLRKLSQPQKVNCCGSIFKNPKNLSAWKLISSSVDESFYSGEIKLSKKHSNFFENEPYINPNKVESFLESVEQKVFSKYNIKLDKELRIYGD